MALSQSFIFSSWSFSTYGTLVLLFFSKLKKSTRVRCQKIISIEQIIKWHKRPSLPVPHVLPCTAATPWSGEYGRGKILRGEDVWRKHDKAHALIHGLTLDSTIFSRSWRDICLTLRPPPSSCESQLMRSMGWLQIPQPSLSSPEDLLPRQEDSPPPDLGFSSFEII